MPITRESEMVICVFLMIFYDNKHIILFGIEYT